MPDFEITSPDGKKFVVTAPEGASQDQVLEYARQQFAAQPKEPSTVDKALDFVKRTGIGVPGGFVTTMASEGMDVANKALNKGAYKAGGVVTDLGAKAGLPPEAAAGLGYATDVAIQAAPVILSGQLAKGAAPSFERSAKGMMQSALKPPLDSLRDKSAFRAIDTLLKEGVSVNASGVAQLRSRIAQLNDEIKSVIASSPATVNKAEVGRRLSDVLEKFKNQVNPQADMEAIKQAWLNFRNHPLLAGKEEIPVQLAQQLKQGTYKVLEGKYGEVGSASTEAQKGLARGLKEEIAKKIPEVAKLNARESDLLNALLLSERRSLMAGNANPGGLAWLSKNPMAMAAFLADKSSSFKSALAQLLYRGQEQIPATAARVVTAPAVAITQNAKE